MAMTQLGNGLAAGEHYEDALSVEEANLSTRRRIGVTEESLLDVQSNIACTYQKLGRQEQALQIERDVYYGRLKLQGGEDHPQTLVAANNFVASLVDLRRFEEAKSLLREMIPVAQRVLGESDVTTLRMRWNYAQSLYEDEGATLDDLRKAVTTLVVTERTARRVLGGAHPLTRVIEQNLRNARAVLAARETQLPASA